MEEFQRKLQSEVENFKLAQKELEKVVSTRQQLDGQLNENEIVKKELDILKEEALVYKSIGPVLIKTDLVEAKQNVSKRIEFIKKEMKRVDDQINILEKKQDTHNNNLQKLQQQFQLAQQSELKKAMRA